MGVTEMVKMYRIWCTNQCHNSCLINAKQDILQKLLRSECLFHLLQLEELSFLNTILIKIIAKITGRVLLMMFTFERNNYYYCLKKLQFAFSWTLG
jgi:hypothetical protein